MCWGAAACGWNKLGPLGRALGWEKKREMSNVRRQGYRKARTTCIHTQCKPGIVLRTRCGICVVGSPRPDSPPT